MEALRLYPQPAREILWVKFPQHVDGETCNIRVFDPAGRLWLDQYLPVFADKTSQVSLSQWPSGLYFLQAKFSDGQFLGKFIRW
jgi:hypothetical protein